MSREFVTMAELKEQLKLENLTPGIDLSTNKLYHSNTNRPQFQLAGFYDYFDGERLQIMGRAETEYFKLLDDKVRLERFDRLCSSGIPGIIYCRGLRPSESVLSIAEKHGVPVLLSEDVTAFLAIRVIRWMSYMLAPTKSMHGVLVDVYGEGILMTGDSGVGKSETAIELIKRGHRLVADDLVEITKISDAQVVGRAPDLTKHFAELRGIGVIDVKSLYGVESIRDEAPIDMVIKLEEWNENSNYDRLGYKKEYENILGVNVVKHTVPVKTGRNLAIIIETAAVNNRQKKTGYDAADELITRVSNSLKKKDEGEDEKA